MWQLRGELRVQAEFLQLPVDFAARTFYKFGSMLIAVSMRFQCVQRFRQTLEPVLMVQQRTHLRMFAYDRPPIGWRVRNLPNRGDHIVAWSVAGLAAQTAVAYSQTCGVVAETWLVVAVACCVGVRAVCGRMNNIASSGVGLM